MHVAVHRRRLGVRAIARGAPSCNKPPASSGAVATSPASTGRIPTASANAGKYTSAAPAIRP